MNVFHLCVRAHASAWLVAFSFGLTALPAAQSPQWHRQGPVPRPGVHQPTTIAFAGARGFVTGINNFPFGEHLLASTDAGRTWQTRLQAQVTTVHFADSTHGWMVGDGDAFRTLDGGQTWQPMTAFPRTSYWSLGSRSQNFAWATHTPWASGYPLQVTHDGGLSWSSGSLGGQELRIADFANTIDGVAWGPAGLAWTQDGGRTFHLAQATDGIMDLAMLDANVALAIRSTSVFQPGELLRSTDGGRTWSVVLSRQSMGMGDDLLPLGGSIVLAHTGIDVLRSTDAGLTWTLLNLPGAQGLSRAAIVGNGNGVVVASSAVGEILRSTDWGASWQLVGPGYGGPLNDFAFVDAATVCAVGNYGAMLRSEDAGATWSWVGSGLTITNLDVAMWDRARGIAIVEDGFKLRTSDGVQWIPQPATSGMQQADVAVAILPGGFAVTVGERGGPIYVSHDYGATWTARTATGGGLQDVQFLTEQVGWVVGDALRIHHTTDGGQTWTTQHHIPSRHVLYRIDMLDARHGFASGSGGALLGTTDGANWQALPIGLQHHGATQGLLVDFANPNTGFLCGSFGFIATSADGGRRWVDRSLAGLDESATELHTVGPNEAFLALYHHNTLQSRLLHTTDGARSWQTVWSGDDSIARIHRSAAGELWICGTRGMILRRDPTGAWVELGAGCTGSAGIPTLGTLGPPRLGQLFVAHAASLPPAATSAALLVGASSSTFLGAPLPFHLAAFGMPGCWLRVSPDVMLTAPAAAGVASFAWGVPNAPTLLARALHLQALAADPSANPLGVVLSDAGTAWVGM